eukprot:1192693-Prorocentrum_minimum.AAC.1
MFELDSLDVARPRSDARPDFRSVRAKRAYWEAIPRRGVPGRRPRSNVKEEFDSQFARPPVVASRSSSQVEPVGRDDDSCPLMVHTNNHIATAVLHDAVNGHATTKVSATVTDIK